MRKILNTLALFSSLSTLLCCALPTLFVTLGMGAAVASVVGSVPQLIWLSERKIYLFSFCGIMLVLGGLLRARAKNLTCPTDPDLAAACKTGRDWSGSIYWISVALFVVGVFFSYVAPLLF